MNLKFNVSCFWMWIYLGFSFHVWESTIIQSPLRELLIKISGTDQTLEKHSKSKNSKTSQISKGVCGDCLSRVGKRISGAN